MKRILILLCALLCLAACGKQEAPASLPFVGQWYTASEFDEPALRDEPTLRNRWLLREDGTFIHAPSMDILSGCGPYEIGHWRVSGGKLRLKIEQILKMSIGESFDESNTLMMYETWQLVPLQPSTKKSFRIAQKETDPESGRRVIAIDGQLFYDFTGQPDFMEDYEECLQHAAANDE